MTQKKRIQRRGNTVTTLRNKSSCTVAVAWALVCAPALAGEVKFEDGVEINYLVTASYGVAKRLSNQSQSLINGPVSGVTYLPSTINSDDGNRNFKKGALINNRASMLGEIDIKRGDLGLFVRGSAFYDAAYRGGSSNTLGSSNKFTPEAQHYEGGRTRLLDTYLYDTFRFSDESSLNIRAGKHVVQWGEGLFFPNVAGAQGPADATKVNLPDAEVKDILMPVGQVSATWRVNPKFSLLSYVQYEFKPTELASAGSYFSYADMLGRGGSKIQIAPGFSIPRTVDQLPSNTGQWGIGSRLQVTDETELGLYYLRYHDKNPSSVSVNFAGIYPASYTVSHMENIKLTGISVSSKIGDVSVAGEVSYKQDVPVLVDSMAGPMATRANATQAQVNFLYTMGPNPLANQLTFVGEYGVLNVSGVKPISVFGQSASTLRSTTTSQSSAIKLIVIPSYLNVFSGWDMDVPITFARQLTGASPVSGAFGSLVGQGDTQYSIGVKFKYLSNFEVSATYNGFRGSQDLNVSPLVDRDYLALNAKYSF